MAIGSMNVSNNSKIDNEIKNLQDKDSELETTLNSKADNNDIAIKSISGKSTVTITDSKDSTVIINDAQRNLFPINFATTTNNGVTYTKNDDGSITMNGTSTGTTMGLFIGSVTLPPGRYFASDITFPEFGHGSIYTTGQNGDTSTWQNRAPFTLTITSKINMYIYTVANVTIDNVTIYPTILKNQEDHPTVYVPYTGYDIVSSNSDGSKTSQISITPDTVFPISGLKCYDGETIITNDYNLDMSISYPTNMVGCSIMNMIGTTDISNVGDGTITGAISALKSYEDMKVINKRIFYSSPPSTGPITLPSNNATYILSLYNTYGDAGHFWIGICLVWSNRIFGIKKMIASDSWDADMTVTYTGLNITTSTAVNYATITKIGHCGDLV